MPIPELKKKQSGRLFPPVLLLHLGLPLPDKPHVVQPVILERPGDGGRHPMVVECPLTADRARQLLAAVCRGWQVLVDERSPSVAAVLHSLAARTTKSAAVRLVTGAPSLFRTLTNIDRSVGREARACAATRGDIAATTRPHDTTSATSDNERTIRGRRARLDMSFSPVGRRWPITFSIGLARTRGQGDGRTGTR